MHLMTLSPEETTGHSLVTEILPCVLTHLASRIRNWLRTLKNALLSPPMCFESALR